MIPTRMIQHQIKHWKRGVHCYAIHHPPLRIVISPKLSTETLPANMDDQVSCFSAEDNDNFVLTGLQPNPLNGQHQLRHRNSKLATRPCITQSNHILRGSMDMGIN